MTSFGPDFSQLIPATSTTPNPGIHNQDGPSGTSIGGELPQQPGQIEKVGKTISGGVVRDVAVALGNVVGTVGDLFENAFEAVSDWGSGILNRFKAIFNGWFGGSSGTGSEAEVTYVIETIKDAVINGLTVSTFTSSTTAWPVPTHVEITGVLIGGGESASGGTGGQHGSFLATPLDLTGISALDIQIGTAGNISYIREANVTPHTGALIAQSPLHGSAGGSAVQGGIFGLTPTNSLPGSGGDGGSGGPGGTEATPGQDSALAVGGARGAAGNFGAHGQPGGSVSAGSQIKCGGAGGGGGGRANVVLNGGGNGGAGGYPGGGGGGRGAGWGGGPNGSVGPGAPGVVWLVYK